MTRAVPDGGLPLADVEYVLPLRWYDDSRLAELTDYLRRLSRWVAVTVVDGSAPELFAAHRTAWPPGVRQLPPDRWSGLNGKVAGVMSGVLGATAERLVIADDDVRYDLAGLRAVAGLLDRADLVRPQNYYCPLPWHARWDTARTLLNRSVAADFPGTLAVRRSTLLAAGGYSGDVLFENLELIRTVKAVGGREHVALGLYVARQPATVGHFRGQRVREAYDDFAQPGRLLLELALLPLTVWSLARPRRTLLLWGAAVALAERGRRRAGGRSVFPPTAALWAPLWMLERAVCVWLALAARPRGIPYAGQRLRSAATPTRVLRRRLRAAREARVSPYGSPPPCGSRRSTA